MFEKIGLTDVEAGAYEALMDQPSASSASIAQATGLSRRAVAAALESLVTKGFVARTGDRGRYLALDPEYAVEAQIVKRQEELQVARTVAAEAAARFRKRSQRARPAELIEILTDNATLSTRFRQMKRAVSAELLVIDVPPYASPLGLDQDPDIEAESRGVSTRTIYAPEALEIPGRLDIIRETVGSGEQARVLPNVRIKLAIFDRKAALMPLSLDEPVVDTGIIVHASFLLQALVTLFDELWRRATPLAFGTATERRLAPKELKARSSHDQLIAMLSAGSTDETIARAMGISRATVERRIRQVLQSVGASTRFQAGLRINLAMGEAPASSSEAGMDTARRRKVRRLLSERPPMSASAGTRVDE